VYINLHIFLDSKLEDSTYWENGDSLRAALKLLNTMISLYHCCSYLEDFRSCTWFIGWPIRVFCGNSLISL